MFRVVENINMFRVIQNTNMFRVIQNTSMFRRVPNINMFRVAQSINKDTSFTKTQTYNFLPKSKANKNEEKAILHSMFHDMSPILKQISEITHL